MVDERGVADRRVEIVLDRDDGDAALGVELLDEGVNFALVFGVDARGGLVQNDELRVAHEGAGDERALGLTAGETAHQGVRLVRQTDLRETVVDDGLVLYFENIPVGVEHLSDRDGKAGVAVSGALGDVAHADRVRRDAAARRL